MKKSIVITTLIIGLFGLVQTGTAAEPQMSTYTSLPVFTVNPVKPNILIILDNSGSMNFNAYGTYPGDYGTVTDMAYAGEPYTPAIEKRVAASRDDAEENLTSHYTYYSGDGGDLDLGKFQYCAAPPCNDDESIVGVRFQSLDIPPGAEIVNAYIEFTARVDLGTAVPVNLKITAEDTDNAAAFNNVNYELTNRTKTSKKVHWDPAPWTANNTYQTPNISSLVQDVVDRSGWQRGNSMAFFIQYESTSGEKRDAYSYDSSAANAPLLHIEYTQAPNQKYYGYFNPDWFYKWSGNKFIHAYKKVGYNTVTCANKWEVEDVIGGGGNMCLADATIATGNSSGLWDGNWMNWATMRRIDIARKVMMGGLATSRTGGGNQTVYGEIPAQSSRNFKRDFDDADGSPVSPYGGSYWYGLKDGYIYIDDDSSVFNGQIARYRLAIDKQEAYEPEDFYEGNVSGVLQKVGDKAWWGNEFFYFGQGTNREGGYIANAVGTNMTTLVTDLQNTGADTWTPLAEAYYVAMQYFKQEKPQSGLGYHNSAIGATNNTMDPFYQDGEFIPCAKNFVILLTDGASTQDENIPNFLKDYDNDGHDPGSFASSGSDYLDDIALYAHSNDLRSDLDGDQNIILYPIYAFGNEDNARDLLRDAARNGGFKDKNGNNVPDGDYTDPAADRIEWDSNGDGIPDTYFEAQDGYLLEAKLLEAINDILKRAASGTAVSVLATSSEGEGNVIQAYFRPVVTSGVTETKWVGYLQSLWVDSQGYLREDTNGNATLDLDADKVLVYFIDANGNTRVNKYAVSAGAEYPDIENDIPIEVSMTDILPIWEAGSTLAERDPDSLAGIGPRKIFTYIDGAAVSFEKANSAVIKPYLGVKDNTAWSYLGPTQNERAENLIHFIRGNDSGFSGTTDMRSRDIEVNGIDQVWKLGDIVHSTPVSIAVPPDNYGLIYSDESYQGYYATRKTLGSRETMVYVGANDGMLHAFTSWQYDSVSKAFSNPSSDPFEEIGTELWAYIPRALLPHLKWLPSTDYTHVYYVDQKPKIVDAKIFYNTLGDAVSGLDITDTVHVNGWGTVLIGGLRMGGKDIDVTDDFDYNSGTADTTKTFSSSYFAIDITDPRNPEVLWEKSYSGLQFTTNEPAVLKVGNKWYVVFGSGPSDYDGTSSETGKIFVVDLATGAPFQNGTNDWLFETAEDDAFMGGAATLDKGLNFNVDAIYIGQTNEKPNGDWEGDMYKVVIPWRCTAADCTNVRYGDLTNGEYVIDPNDVSNPWYLTKLYDTNRPITAPPALSIDFSDNTWVYFGTGRYLSQADKTTTDEQYLYGIKDPFFNRQHKPTGSFADDYYHNYNSSLTLDQNALLDSDIFKVAYPWGTYDLPAGDCSTVPTGQVGDIYMSTDPGACVCSYDWPTPISVCTEATAGHCAVEGISLGAEIFPGQYAGDQIFDDGDCVCRRYNEPVWGCKEVTAGSGACNPLPVGTGVIASTATYRTLYWGCRGADDNSCVDVTFGEIGTGLGDGTCECYAVTPPAWSCDERLAGDCSTVSPPPEFGVEGDIEDAAGGFCRAGYWTCVPTDPATDPDACARTGHAVDYSLTTGFLGAASDGDYFGDGSCFCSFVNDPIAVVIDTTTNLGMSFDDLVDLARQDDGWFRTLPDPGERSLTKPAMLGGLALFTTYVPSTETCEFGGYSYLWALYYETGTAYKAPVFDVGTVLKAGLLCLTERSGLGRGLASSVGIHVGKQAGGKAKGFVQLSTGVIVEIPIDPAFNIRSGLRYWREN